LFRFRKKLNHNQPYQGEKMNKGTAIVFRVVLALVIIGAIIGLGVYAYNIGLTQGVVQNTQIEAGKTVPAPYFGMPYRWHAMGGFGCFGVLVPLFLLFVIFCAFRGLFGYRSYGWHHMHGGPWGMHRMGGNWDPDKDVPPMVEEWHRRMHEQAPVDKTEKK
jgi:hypothetical protein